MKNASFVTGAVISEMLTAGFATSAIVAKSGQLMNKMGRGVGIGIQLKMYISATWTYDWHQYYLKRIIKKGASFVTLIKILNYAHNRRERPLYYVCK